VTDAPRSPYTFIGVVFGVALGLTTVAFATEVEFPYSFTADTVISASQMNSNFEVAAEAIEQLVPTGAVMHFRLATCPPGWSPLESAAGRYLVGVTDGGTVGEEVGGSLAAGEARASGTHSHGMTHSHSDSFSLSDPGHSHPGRAGSQGSLDGGTARLVTSSVPGAGAPGTMSTTTGISLSGSVGGSTEGQTTDSGAGAVAAPYIALLVCEKE